MKDLPKRLSNQDVLKALKADLKAADTLRLEIVSKVEAWEKAYNGEPYGNEEKGKSELVSRDIKRQDEWQHASVKDPFVSDQNIIKCAPVTFEDRPLAEQTEEILNYQFTRQFNRYKFITNVVKLFYKQGTVIAKTSWCYEDEKEKEKMPMYGYNPETGQIEVVEEIEVENIKVIKNRPDVELCRLEDIYVDPTCRGDIDKAQFIIHRYESDLSTLRKTGKYKNLAKVAKNLVDAKDEYDYQEEDETEFRFGDTARKKVLVYEYWGNFDVDNDGIAEPIVCTWIGDVIVQLQSNPFPDKKIPFLAVANNSTPFTLHGEANAELIGDNQKVSTAIKRGIMDNMANSNNSQKGIPIGMLDTLNKRRFLNGKNFEFNGTAANIFEGNYNQIPASVFNVLDMVNHDSESMLGVKSFSGGINGQGLGSTATSARGALDAVAVRRLDIVRNIAENLIKPLMRKWAAYNSEFLSPEEIQRITNKPPVEILKDDIQGKLDIHIEVSTAEDNAAKAQEMSFLLQTLGQGLPPELQMILMSQIAKLHRMPDLAEQLINYKPQPDPYVEQMRMLEMEKLKAEIAERQSRANENATDIRVKNAKAGLDEARAQNISSDTDLKDLDFTKKASGEDFAQRMAEKDHDRNSKLLDTDLKNEVKRQRI